MSRLGAKSQKALQLTYYNNKIIIIINEKKGAERKPCGLRITVASVLPARDFRMAGVSSLSLK